MSWIRHRLALAAACVMLFVGSAPALAVDRTEAAGLVNHAIADALNVFVGQARTQEENWRVADQLVEHYTDLRVIAATILGHYWTRAVPADQAQFMRLLVAYALAGWAGSVTDISPGTKVTVTGTETVGDHVVVHCLATAPGDPNMLVDFDVSAAGDRLIISDAAVENVSFIHTMRDDFTSVLYHNGGRLDALMADMQQKVQNEMAAVSK